MLEAPDRVHPRRWCQGEGAPHSGHSPSGHPQHVRQDHSECGRAGVDAYGWDCALERRPWGFAFDEIGADMWIFHGEQDWAVQPSEARTLAATVPSSQLRLFPDAGHGLILVNWGDILGDLEIENGHVRRARTAP